MTISEVASGIHYLEVGRGITRSNVYFVRSGHSWVLIDTGSTNCDQQIQEAAQTLFGVRAAPDAILLTHDHPDHAGSTRKLAQAWGCPVYLHSDELPLATVDERMFFSTYDGFTTSSGRWVPPPLDRWVLLPMMHLVPRRRRESMLSEASFKDAARAVDPTAGIRCLPDWQCIHTPGHTRPRGLVPARGPGIDRRRRGRHGEPQFRVGIPAVGAPAKQTATIWATLVHDLELEGR